MMTLLRVIFLFIHGAYGCVAGGTIPPPTWMDLYIEWVPRGELHQKRGYFLST